jgi:hypothetical protein
MTFDELKIQIKSCGFGEVRVDNNDFFEGVILKKNLEGLNAKLSSIFGPPAWPSENKLTNEVNSVVQNNGGIMAGQSLYFTHIDNLPVFVMLWPWGDKEHITVKIGKNTNK